MITLKNDFHNTEVRLNPKGGTLSASQIRRSEKVLCGIDGCTCGDAGGMRGQQDYEVEFDMSWDGKMSAIVSPVGENN